jgi:hypothetical protein
MCMLPDAKMVQGSKVSCPFNVHCRCRTVAIGGEVHKVSSWFVLWLCFWELLKPWLSCQDVKADFFWASSPASRSRTAEARKNSPA